MAATVVELGAPADPVRNHWSLPSDLLLMPDQLPSLRADLAEMRRLAAKLGIPIRVDPALDRPDAEPNLLRGVFMLDRPCRVFETKLLVGPDGAVGSCPMMSHVSFRLSGRAQSRERLGSHRAVRSSAAAPAARLLPRLPALLRSRPADGP